LRSAEMGKPITTKAGGICFAFPNVCNTQVGPATVPIPYPSVGQLAAAEDTEPTVLAGTNEVVTKASFIETTTGDAAGSLGGVTSGTFGKKVTFISASETVFAKGSGIVRMLDQTEQNNGNARGVVLGGFPRVLVGD
jgi:hypothetical protein